MTRITIFIISFLLLLNSCTIKRFSDGDKLRRLLLTKTDEFNKRLKKNESIDALHKFRALKNDTTNAGLRMFDEGGYVLRIENDERDSIKRIRRDTTRAIEYVTVVGSKSNDSLNPVLSDKISYLVFLDDERVLYHSPYRKIYVKGGDFGRVKTMRPYSKKYVKDTDNYFKLGTYLEYNSCRRGYYKMTKVSKNSSKRYLQVCLEISGGRGYKSPSELVTLSFFVKEKDGKVIGLVLNQAYFKDNFIDIDNTFKSFALANESSKNANLNFSFYAKPFKLLLVKRTQDSETINIVTKIQRSGNTRFYDCEFQYHCKDKICLPAATIAEPLNSLFTF